MESGDEIQLRDALRGQRMIEVKVRFWTNSISGSKAKVRPKHGLTAGVVRIANNAAHGLKDVKPIPFDSLWVLPAAIEKLLIREAVKLHPSRQMRKYIEPHLKQLKG